MDSNNTAADPRDRPHRLLGITGTDTGIGKTVVSCALAARARQLGVQVAAMKPVESGVSVRPIAGRTQLRSDAERLHEAAGADVDLATVRPYVLDEPLAPFVAAQRAGIHIDVSRLDDALHRLQMDHDLVIVEGAGGLLVPLTTELSYADLFGRWGAQLVVVAGNRLGVMNHILLTLDACRSRELPVSAVVLTALSERDADLAEATNYDALRTLLPQVPLFRFPWVDRIDDPGALAIAAERSGLDVLLGAPHAVSSPSSA